MDTGALAISATQKRWIAQGAAEPSTAEGQALLSNTLALLPDLAREAENFERLGRLSDDWVQTLAEAGLYRAWTPAALGGTELPTQDFMRVLETLAMADTSVAWCVFIATTSATALASIPLEAGQRIAADPHHVMAGVFAPNGTATAIAEGQWEVSGQWRFGSGTFNAQWVLAGCLFSDADGNPIENRGQRRQHMVILPRDQILSLDNWEVSGLCGSGSSDFRVDKAIVPDAMVVGLDPSVRLDTPLYRHPTFALLGTGFGAIALGCATAALTEATEAVIATAKSQKNGSGIPSSEARRVLSEEEASIRSARLLFYDAAQVAWQTSLTGKLTREQRRDMRLSVLHALSCARATLFRLQDVMGTLAIRQSTPIQRRARDLNVIAQHVMVRNNLWPVLTGMEMGAELPGSQFI